MTRAELLQIKHLSVPTVLATTAVLLSTDRDGRVRRGRVAARLAGVTAARAQRRTHEAYWQRLSAEARAGGGPLWVVLGDSAAQAIGAADPADGYVGRVRAALAGRDGVPWRVLNLSSAGALVRDVLAEQLPDLLARTDRPDLISCGVGCNDALRTPPRRLRRQLDEVAARLPAGSVLLNIPAGIRGFGGSYMRWVNAGIAASAARHGHRVADVERWFSPPWRGKFGPDRFHPSAAGYAEWAAAVLAALGVERPPPGGDLSEPTGTQAS